MEVQTVNFEGVGIYRSAFKNEKFSVQKHIHQFCEIIYVLDGEFKIISDDNEHTLTRGDMAFLHPFEVHTIRTPKRVHLWLCVFSNELIHDFISEDELYRGRSDFYFKPSERLRAYIEGTLPDSNEEIVAFSVDEQRRIKALLIPILNEYISSVPPSSKDGHKALLVKILLYLSRHYTENITIADVAKSLGYTARHISRSLTLKNYNFRSLLNSFRVERAKILIRKTNMTMLDISLESGFSNERSFYRAFLQIEGSTPREYKLRVKG